MSYAKLLNTGTLKQVDLIEKVGLSQLQINRYMAFSQIPAAIWDATLDPFKVSARTATEIRALSKKGDQYVKAMIQLASKIRDGKIGATNLKKEVDKILKGGKPTSQNKAQQFVVNNRSGKLLFKCSFNADKRHFSLTVPEKLSDKFNPTTVVAAIEEIINGNS